MTQLGEKWSGFAGNQPNIRSPQAPQADDGAAMLHLAADVLARGGPLRILVLGVTSGIINLAWPDGADLIMVDANPQAIAGAQGVQLQVPAQAVLAGWDAMPLADGSIDLIVGDASLNALPDRQAYAAVVAECARVLAPGGAVVLRCFARGNPHRTPEQVVASPLFSETCGLSPFRMDIGMSLCGDDSFLDLNVIVDAFNALEPDRDAFCARAGAPRNEIDRVIDGTGRIMAGVRINYPTLDQLSRWVAPHFRIEAVCEAGYVMGQFCPTVRLGLA